MWRLCKEKVFELAAKHICEAERTAPKHFNDNFYLNKSKMDYLSNASNNHKSMIHL